ncbi:hypothetical protein [Pedococcus bigeumensis]|uniref:hypothetical protein n=1 Tax=Pedococcus bigeumensis TaxID=433644 RepID=UPI00138664A0|nr:hypothetical protein [Pedococcus bigeumensis]
MSNTTSIRRAASILGATGLIALSMAGTASAREVPGNGGAEELRCSTNCYQGPDAQPTNLTTILRVDDNAIEVLQLGAGLFAGIALAGAGAALASRRTHAHMAHPA